MTKTMKPRQPSDRVGEHRFSLEIARMSTVGIRIVFASATIAVALVAPMASATSSSPIAITSDDRFVWVVNPDNNSVSVIEVGGDLNLKIAEIPVGEQPRRLAITPDDRKVYVTNQLSGTVSVIDAVGRRVIKTISVGTEPIGCALNPRGTKLYIANFSSNDLSIIDTDVDRVTKTVSDVALKPLGLAVTDEKVYIAYFLAQLRGDARSVVEKEGRDDGKEGRVTVLSPDGKIRRIIILNPLANVGFASNGSVLDRIPATDPPAFTFQTGAFPNLLESPVLKGDRAYIPNVGTSPNGPVRFNVNVQPFLSVFDTVSDQDSGQTINLNRGVQFEPLGKRLFFNTPIALAFKHNSNEGFIVSAATDRLVRVVLQPDGTPTINAPAGIGDPGNIIRIEVGIDPPGTHRNSNPQGIVINSTDTCAYVMNFISRDVSVVNISGDPSQYRELVRISSASLPLPGTMEAIIHRGNELFNTSIGPEGTQDNARSPAGRMSDTGWISCYSCHPHGLANGSTFLFGDGPRKVISLHSTFEHRQPPGAPVNGNGAPLPPAFFQRVIAFSASGAETEADSEITIRDTMGGQGLITLSDGSPDPCVFNLLPPDGSSCAPMAVTGRSADIDSIAAFLAFGIQAPISPRRGQDQSRGRRIFERANCQSCHGGPNWTRNRVDFNYPPVSEQIVESQLVRFLFDVGTFNPNAFNEVRASGTDILVANGAFGINIPSLISVFANGPYLHNGAAQTLDDVLQNITHRSAGTAGVDTLRKAAQRKALIRFLESIDETTPIFP